MLWRDGIKASSDSDAMVKSEKLRGTIEADSKVNPRKLTIDVSINLALLGKRVLRQWFVREPSKR